MFPRKFGTGLVLQVGIKFLAVSLGFFTTRWLIENLGIKEYETYNLVTTYTNIILMVVSLGIPNLIQKFYTNHDDEQRIADFWTTFGIIRLVSFIVGITLIFLTFPLSQTHALLEIIVIFTAQFILLADLNYRSVCDAKGHSWQFSATDFLGKFVLVLFLFASIWFQISFPFSNLIYFATCSIVAYSIGIAVDALWQRKYTKLGSFRWSIILENAQPLLYLGVSGFVVATFLTTDKLFLKYFGYSAEVINGYSNSYRLFDITTIIPGLTTPTLASWVKRSLHQGKLLGLGTWLQKRFKHIQAKWLIVGEWTVYTLLLGLGTTLGLLLFGGFALHILDTAGRYPLAWPVLPYLAWAMIPLSPMLLYTNLVIFLGGERDELIAVILSGGLELILYVTLIPHFSLFGAALATTAMYISAFFIKGYFLVKRVQNFTP